MGVLTNFRYSCWRSSSSQGARLGFLYRRRGYSWFWVRFVWLEGEAWVAGAGEGGLRNAGKAALCLRMRFMLGPGLALFDMFWLGSLDINFMFMRVGMRPSGKESWVFILVLAESVNNLCKSYGNHNSSSQRKELDPLIIILICF